MLLRYDAFLSPECQQEKPPISTLWCSSVQTLGGRPLHFSASEQKQTWLPEDRENFPPACLYHTVLMLVSACTNDIIMFFFCFWFLILNMYNGTSWFSIWKYLFLLDGWMHVSRSLPGPPAFPVKCCTVLSLPGSNCYKIHSVAGRPLKRSDEQHKNFEESKFLLRDFFFPFSVVFISVEIKAAVENRRVLSTGSGPFVSPPRNSL